VIALYDNDKPDGLPGNNPLTPFRCVPCGRLWVGQPCMRGLALDDPRRDKEKWRRQCPRPGLPDPGLTHEQIAEFIAYKYRGDLLIWDFHPKGNYLSIMLVDRRKFRWNL
jgi:hypothetical protein